MPGSAALAYPLVNRNPAALELVGLLDGNSPHPRVSAASCRVELAATARHAP
jgi:hypothetical protein